jgi:hypothetical protein
MDAAAVYPVTLEVDYSERQSRWKTLLRLLLQSNLGIRVIHDR